MKKGWPKNSIRIGDVFKTAAGGTPLTSKREYYDGGTIPWLMSGEVRSVPPPIVAGSNANAAFGALFALAVEVTKLIPPKTGVAVQPFGIAGAVTASKFCVIEEIG